MNPDTIPRPPLSERDYAPLSVFNSVWRDDDVVTTSAEKPGNFSLCL
jgi:hypothetical protein